MGRELSAFGKASVLAGACGLVATALFGAPARAQEAPECRSTDPSQIPEPSKPYFMVVVDTSSSMLGCASPDVPAIAQYLCDDPLSTGCNSCPDVAPDNSCGLEPTRLNSAKCALRKTVQAFAGEVNFGLETYPFLLSNCPAGACADSCVNADGSCDPPNFGSFEGEFYGCTVSTFADPGGNASCGNTPNCAGTLYPNPGLGADWSNGGSIAVDLLQDRNWDSANQPPSNVSDLLAWFDGDCTDSREIFALGATPLEGSLRSAHQYIAQGWASDWSDTTFCDGDVPSHASPLDPNDRPCRSLNIILVTDGDETCGGDPTAAALSLYNTGVTNGGTANIPVKTFVIGFAGVPDPTSIDNIADAGDDGVLNSSADALIASNETDLAQALAQIIGGSISPEVCDNVDNNCNGCTDELYQVYCNRSRTPTDLATLQTSGDSAMCCSWTNDTERQACLDAHAATISSSNRTGDQWLLPCWDPADTATYGTDPTAAWLCSNPGDVCDEVDNNCELTFSGDLTTNTSDENQKKCVNDPDNFPGQLFCPQAEDCDGVDDDCDGVIDNDPSTPGTPYSLPNCFQCQPQNEICDGCDNDNDGTVDGFTEPCALAPTEECRGERLCPTVPGPSCDCSSATGNSFQACDVSANHNGPVGTDDTTCDQHDDDCDGVRDEDAAPTDCFFQGNASLYYGPESRCDLGLQACNSTVCVGAIGPATEICDGNAIDDNCDGFVDGRRPAGTLVACDPLDATSCNGQGANSFCAEDLIEGTGNFYCVLPAVGTGGSCGTDNGTCTKGTIQCIGGTAVCTGGVQPQPEDCNGIDDDCDLQIDEGTLVDAPATSGCWNTAGTTCSHEEASWGIPAGTDATCDSAGSLVAPCRIGTLSCSSGAWVCVGPKAPTAEVCDGVDNDCDGTPDDGTGGGACGTDVGECTAGTFECIGGVLTCNGTNPQTEVCNGLDDDCDGQGDDTDPDVLGEGDVCGTDVGACQSGLTECINNSGTWELVCQGEIGSSPETCNGIDDNCNGQIDEAPTDAPANLGCWNFTTGAGTCSAVGLTWDPPPGATCTGLGTLTSPCAPGVLVCTGGTGWECQGGTVPQTETCDGLDNNCDGTPDDNNPGGGGQCPPTGTNVGECNFGTLACVNGGLICQGEQGPVPEVCDGLDNDCNGTDDDNITTGIGNPCGFSTGVCERGVTACVSGSIQCTGGVNPGDEICNGLDDDCDGFVDEDPTDAPADAGCWSPTNTTSGACSAVGLFWDPPDPSATCTTAGSLSTPCTEGTLVCVNGAWGCQGGLAPSGEVCDGIDNDCDGAVDEPGTPPDGITGTTDPANPSRRIGEDCSTDIGACDPGTWECVSGAFSCANSTTPTPETCNNVDDDCDGFIDGTAPPTPVSCNPANGDADCASEGIFSRCVESQLSLTNFFCVRPPAGFGGVCGTSLGACEQGVLACVAGAPVCLGEVTGSAELCNGLDDDCNGVIDDALTDAPASPGCWNNAGSTCSFDSLTWDPPTGATCTGLGSLTSPCFTGTIVCDGTSGWICQGGRLPSGEVCDGVDNDCDGTKDDGDPGGGASCGASDVGVCAFGTERCDATIGQVVCTGEVTPKTELCNGQDNDCDGFVDGTRPSGTLVTCDPADSTSCDAQGANSFCQEDLVEGTGTYYCVLPTPGTGNACGVSTGACAKGTTVCIGGTLVCQGGVQAVPEECDGIDNNCNGLVDDGTLTDAPTGAAASCWSNQGTTCSYEEATWDPPPGANCTDLGTLRLPCSLGFLQCNGLSGWACTGGTLPVAEVCDGIDNNCDGTPDDGDPGGGAACGDSTGACEQGVEACVSGTIQCTGAVGPAPEVCDGIDNDCDGDVDDGIKLGEPCAMTYDTVAFPGVRSPGVGICRAGVTDCDPNGSGAFICINGQGPEPEVCDGLDNDCDGVIDELGPPPDGITGTADPDDSTRVIGENCGTDLGECDFGQYACRGGQFVCEGGRAPQREVCDCLDNDCDGDTDEEAAEGEPTLCAGDAVCATLGGVCQCADECQRGEFPCPTGTVCERGTPISGTPDTTVDVCWDDPCPGGCESKTVTRADDSIECGPAGTLDADGNPVPVCTCRGEDGCHGPCYRIQCATGSSCVRTAGQFQGTCRPENDCRFFGCSAGEACAVDVCVASPCDATTCDADQVCKPNSTFDDSRCVGSCIDVDCGAGEVCREGACEPTGCGVDCPTGEVCLPGGGDGGGACGESPCAGTFCADGAYCEPTTGACIQNPCAGVICPTGGVCQAGECVREVLTTPDAGTGGTSGTGGAGGAGAVSGSGGTGATVDAGGSGGSAGGGQAGSGNRANRDDSDDVIGLATGGGGCRCDVPGNKTSSEAWLLALLAMGAAATRRGARKEGGAR